MSDFHILSPSEQVAEHLKKEIMKGHWHDTMPGGPAIAKELGIDGKTVWAALKLLEKQGLVMGQGPGRRSKITLPKGLAAPTMRVAILDYDPLEQTEEWSLSLRRMLISQGHSAFFTKKSQTELGMDVNRIARLVKKTPADAWIICSGSRDLLEWFTEYDTPAFAQFGRRKGLHLAGVGPDHVSACREATRHLIEQGHQRIVVLVRESQRAGGPGQSVRVIFKEMESRGIRTGSYNLPEWDDSPEGLHKVIKELFRLTPPTALIIDEPFLFHAVKEHLAQSGLIAPRDVSLICTDPDPTFTWCKPSVAHNRWDHRPVIRRVVEWVNNIARGKEDFRQSLTKAEFINGGTVGPAPK